MLGLQPLGLSAFSSLGLMSRDVPELDSLHLYPNSIRPTCQLYNPVIFERKQHIWPTTRLKGCAPKLHKKPTVLFHLSLRLYYLAMTIIWILCVVKNNI